MDVDGRWWRRRLVVHVLHWLFVLIPMDKLVPVPRFSLMSRDPDRA